MRDALLGSKWGAETGGQVYQDVDTQDIRIVSGADAGRGSKHEFLHNVRSRPNEKLQLISHSHVQWDERGIWGRKTNLLNNAPSPIDQRAMKVLGIPVQTVAAKVTTTLYRLGGIDRLRIDAGSRNALPSMIRQGIVVDPEVGDDATSGESTRLRVDARVAAVCEVYAAFG